MAHHFHIVSAWYEGYCLRCIDSNQSSEVFKNKLALTFYSLYLLNLHKQIVPMYRVIETTSSKKTVTVLSI